MSEHINVDESMVQVVKIAIEEYEKRQNKKIEKKSFHNTELLMKNYNDFMKHVNFSISDINDVQRIVKLDLKENECDELFILSIKQSKAKTLIMTSHIEKSLELLEKEQKKEGTLEKYRALEMYYVDGKSYEKISEELNCGINTPKRWITQMIKRLGIYLFGIDGIKLEW